jgi:hypothetical protein
MTWFYAFLKEEGRTKKIRSKSKEELLFCSETYKQAAVLL